jgi:hypothetical protein
MKTDAIAVVVPDFVEEALASASAIPSPKCSEKEKQGDDKDGVPKAPGKKRKAADEAGAHARKCQLVKEVWLKRCNLSHLTPRLCRSTL